MNRELKIRVIEHLRGLSSGKIKPKDTSNGLCHELKDTFRIHYVEIEDLIEGYPNHSGNNVFPIKSFNKKYTASGYYLYTKNKWRGKQGIERKKLCSWIADKLEKELNDERETM